VLVGGLQLRPIFITVLWVITLDWSHNFAVYVINTAGLEDIGCRQYFYKLLVGFKQKILKIAFESQQNKFQWEFFNGSHRLNLLVSVRQNQPPFMSLLYHWPIIASKLYSISFFKSGILLQQPIALLKGVSAHFSHVYCTILKEVRGREILNPPGYTSQQPLDPFS